MSGKWGKAARGNVCLSVGTALLPSQLMFALLQACVPPSRDWDRSRLYIQTPHDSPSPDACGALSSSLMRQSTPPFSRRPARSQMKHIVVWASILYAAHVYGATVHVTGPDERQVVFGDGTTSFATLSGGEGLINSTVTVNAPDFVTMTGTSVNDMMTLIREQQATIVSQQVEIETLKTFVGMVPPSSPPNPPLPSFLVTCAICFDNQMTGAYVDGAAASVSNPVVGGRRYTEEHRFTFWSNASVVAFRGNDFENGCGSGGFSMSCESVDPRWNSNTNNLGLWSVWSGSGGAPEVMDGEDWTSVDYPYNPAFQAGKPDIANWRDGGKCPTIPALTRNCGGPDQVTVPPTSFWYIRYHAISVTPPAVPPPPTSL